MDFRLFRSWLAGTNEAGGAHPEECVGRTRRRKAVSVTSGGPCPSSSSVSSALLSGAQSSGALCSPNQTFCARLPVPSQEACLNCSVSGSMAVLFWAFLPWEDRRQVLLKIICKVLSPVRHMLPAQQMSKHLGWGKALKKKVVKLLGLMDGFFRNFEYIHMSIIYVCTWVSVSPHLHVYKTVNNQPLVEC